jgi:hypothetical protein
MTSRRQAIAFSEENKKNPVHEKFLLWGRSQSEIKGGNDQAEGRWRPAIDNKQPIHGQDLQTCTRDTSSLTPPIFGNFIEAQR